MKRYGIIALPIFLFCFILLIMHIIDPQEVGPAGILFVFTSIYLFFLAALTVILYFSVPILQRLGLIRGGSKSMKPQKAYYIASVVACFPVFLLAIMSIGELSFTDVLLVGLFTGLASFYVARRT